MKSVRFINQELLSYFRGRTLDAIKEFLKRPNTAFVSMKTIRETEAVVTKVIDPQIAVEDEECDRALFDYFSGLNPPDFDEFRAISLHDICRHVGREDSVATLDRLAANLLELFPHSYNVRSVNRQ
ncbi:hypothetical protein K0M31_007123 [Melipona bicolor]|uniref:Uncharacterized protein n=1 Tax=Melipona bicolor TaxID=60889 RepID=A0AA40FRN8_9HYME|nr:hypothetical protein K0M31_007123 [Melipona bicolor]